MTWSGLSNATGATRDVSRQGALTSTRIAIPMAAFGPADASGSRYAVAIVRTHHPTFSGWQVPITVTVRARQGRYDVVGIDRVSGQPAGR